VITIAGEPEQVEEAVVAASHQVSKGCLAVIVKNQSRWRMLWLQHHIRYPRLRMKRE
jgi:hypothetical protein